jgi:ssDNA-binding replication factor A large subunit
MMPLFTKDSTPLDPKMKSKVIEDSLEILDPVYPSVARFPFHIKKENSSSARNNVSIKKVPERKIIQANGGFVKITPEKGTPSVSVFKEGIHPNDMPDEGPQNKKQAALCLISELDPSKKTWKIHALVQEKSPQLEFNTAKGGSGERFYAILKDKWGNTIRASFFNDSCGFWHHSLEEGKSYVFSHGTVKYCHAEYQTGTTNMEIVFHVSSLIIPKKSDIDWVATVSPPIKNQPKSSSEYPRSDCFTTIQDLNDTQVNASIYAKVTKKMDVYSFANGGGKVQNFILCDVSGWDIRCATFQDSLDLFSEVLQVGKCYSFSGFRVKPAAMMYNKCKSAYEMTLAKSSRVQLIENGPAIPDKMQLYTSLEDLFYDGEKVVVNILAIVRNVGESVSVTCKDGRETVRSELILVDSSGRNVKLTLWGDKNVGEAAENFKDGPVVSFCQVEIGEYNNEINLTLKGDMTVNPDTAKARKLHDWWVSNGKVGKE